MSVFNSIVYNAIIEEGTFIAYNAVVTNGVRIPANRFVPPGGPHIDTQEKKQTRFLECQEMKKNLPGKYNV
ncbi:hypothetical protein GCM10020331_057400 [Ectobacillus funiculus]